MIAVRAVLVEYNGVVPISRVSSDPYGDLLATPLSLGAGLVAASEFTLHEGSVPVGGFGFRTPSAGVVGAKTRYSQNPAISKYCFSIKLY